METKILLDSCVIISAVIDIDFNHRAAIELIKNLQNFQKIYVTNYIYAEISTVISQRKGKPHLLSTKEFIEESNIQEIFIDRELHANIKAEHLKEKNKDVSFVDLLSALVCKKHGISNIMTFDKHFYKLGKRYSFKVIDK